MGKDKESKKRKAEAEAGTVAVQQQQQPQHHHASPPYGAAKGKTHQGTAVTVQLPEENQPALVCYFPAGHPPADASFTLYEHTVGSHASKRQRAAFTLVGTKGNISYLGRSQGDDYIPGPQPCSYALGVYDKESGKLQVMPLAGNHIVRVEPRLPGLNYSTVPTNVPQEDDDAADTREARLEENKRLVSAFGSTRRRRQLNAREEGIVHVDKLGGAVGALQEMLGEAAAAAAAAGLTKEAIKAAATEVRVLPPYNLQATSPEEAYPIDELIPHELASALRIGKILRVAEDQESFREMKEKGFMPAYILNRVPLLRDPDRDLIKRRARLMAALECFLKLKTKHTIFVDPANGGLDKAARGNAMNTDALQALLDMDFYHKAMEGSMTRYGRDKTGDARLVAYICVAALLLEPGATVGPAQFDDLCEALKLPAEKLIAHFKEVGAAVTSSARPKGVERREGQGDRAYTVVLMPDRSKTLAQYLPEIKIMKRATRK